jgi:hypothetical protein
VQRAKAWRLRPFTLSTLTPFTLYLLLSLLLS